MLSFTNICVAIVITICIMVGTAFIGFLTDPNTYDSDFTLGAWIMSSIGFGTCLTILLIDNGVI